jgi:O-antigen ligase
LKQRERAISSGSATGSGIAPFDTPSVWSRATLVIATLPVVAGPNGFFETELTLNFFDHQRLLEMAALATLALLAIGVPSIRRDAGAALSAITPLAAAGLALFLALGLVSSLLNESPIPSLLEWGTFLLALGATASIAGARWRLGREGDVWLLVVVIGGLALYFGNFLAIYLPTVPHPDVTIFWTTPFYHFPNVRFLNQLQTWTLPLLAGATLLAGPYSRTLQALLATTGGAWWALLLATGGRGSLIAATLSSLIVLAVFKTRAFRWLATTGLLVGAGLIIYLVLFEWPGGSPGLGRAAEKVGTSDQARLGLWTHALRVTAERPLMGVGPMGLAMDTSSVAHPHNALFQLLAEWGLPATLGAIAAVFAGVFAWLKSWQSPDWRLPDSNDPWSTSLAPALSASLLAGLGHSMVSGILVMPMSQVMAIIVSGWALGLFCHRGSKGAPPSPAPTGFARRQTVIAFISAAGLATAVPGTAYSLTGLAEANRHYRQLDGFRFHPRFWLQGDINLRPWTEGKPTPQTSREGESRP